MAESGTPPAATPVPAAGTDVGGRALLLDNDPSALAALASVLHNWRWQTHAIAGPAELDTLPWRPDVLLLDYHLDRGATGLDVLRQMRAEYGDIPAAILTGDRDPALRRQVLATGASALYKPLKPLALRQWLRRVQTARQSART